MPRVPRFAPPGWVFHVINRGNARAKIFRKPGDYLAFLSVVDEALQLVPVKIYAFVVMPNHWHFVLEATRQGDLARFMQRLTVRHVRRWHEHNESAGTGHLYQGTYKSFPVQEDAHFLALCRYVERNPLRAGLVERAEQWGYSSLVARGSSEAGDSIRKLLAPWPVDVPANWIAQVNRAETDAELEAIRTSIRRGRPFGSEKWQQKAAAKLKLGPTLKPRGRPKKVKG